VGCPEGKGEQRKRMSGNAIRLLRALVDEAVAEKQTMISCGRCAFKVHGSRSGSVYATEGAAGSWTRPLLGDCGQRIQEALDGSS
jgi:uncharacterized low-complexity protein